MIILFTIALGIIVSVTGLFAAEFQPTIMKLSCPQEITYEFNDEPLTIPLTITGTPAAVWLVINTKGQAENIVDVRNGYLGWHYVNKIDTTVYVSPRYERDIGETEIIWDGRNQDGNPVEPGIYDYYLWAYDDKSERQLASYYSTVGFMWESQYSHIYELGEDSLPLANPLIAGSYPWWNCDRTDNNSYRALGSHYKWRIGSDPEDQSFLQTTRCTMYDQLAEEAKYVYEYSYGGPVFDPHDYSIFYHCCVHIGNNKDTMFKWSFVTDGEAVRDEDWLGWDELIWEDLGQTLFIWSQKPSCFTDRNYIYMASPGKDLLPFENPESGKKYTGEWNKLRCVSFDGEVIFDKMMHDWYFSNEPWVKNYRKNINGAFNKLFSRGNNHWFLLGLECCMHQMIDTTRLLEDPDDETDMVVFENGNGDYFLDVGFHPDSEPAWYCLAHSDPDESMYRDSICIDSNNFNIIFTSWNGLNSFGVSTQDGTGIGYMAFADDTVTEGSFSGQKGGGLLCDSGTNYDGLYMNGPRNPNTGYFAEIAQTYFVAFDSAHGIITNKPTIVEVKNPLVFSVEQNTPNPFNPTTTISFTLPGAENVTINIYNIAGQKVDSPVNDFMDTGRHSVLWDASEFSAGIYFYTIKAGKHEKTMKMTLLK